MVLELSVFFLSNSDLSIDLEAVLLDFGHLLLALSGTAGLGDLSLVGAALLIWDNHVLGTDGGGGTGSGGSEGTDTGASLEVSLLSLEAGVVTWVVVAVLEAHELGGPVSTSALGGDGGKKCSNNDG